MEPASFYADTLNEERNSARCSTGGATEQKPFVRRGFNSRLLLKRSEKRMPFWCFILQPCSTISEGDRGRNGWCSAAYLWMSQWYFAKRRTCFLPKTHSHIWFARKTIFLYLHQWLSESLAGLFKHNRQKYFFRQPITDSAWLARLFRFTVIRNCIFYSK